MTVQATPYVETALSHSAELFRRELQSGLPLGSAGGVVPATPAASASVSAGLAGCSDLQVTAGSGMSVNVAAGQGIVPGSLGSGSGYGMGIGYGYPTITTNGASAPTVASNANATVIQLTTQGAYYVYNDDSAGAVNLTIAASNPSNPRIDVVGMQVEDADYSGSNNDWKLAVVTGTAASSPAVPTFPANFVPLALVWVGANVSSITTIVDLRVAYNRNPFRAEMFRTASFSSLTTVDTVIPYDTVYSDVTGGCTTGSAALFTVPVAGLWHMDTCVGATANTITLIRFLRNGSVARQPWDIIGDTQAVNTAGASTSILLSESNTVSVTARASAASTGMLVGQSSSYFSLYLAALL